MCQAESCHAVAPSSLARIQSAPAGTFAIKSANPLAAIHAGAVRMTSRSATMTRGAGQRYVCFAPSGLRSAAPKLE